MFGAHAEMAEDPEFRSEVEERVRSLGSPDPAVLGERLGSPVVLGNHCKLGTLGEAL